MFWSVPAIPVPYHFGSKPVWDPVMVTVLKPCLYHHSLKCLHIISTWGLATSHIQIIWCKNQLLMYAMFWSLYILHFPWQWCVGCICPSILWKLSKYLIIMWFQNKNNKYFQWQGKSTQWGLLKDCGCDQICLVVLFECLLNAWKYVEISEEIALEG